VCGFVLYSLPEFLRRFSSVDNEGNIYTIKHAKLFCQQFCLTIKLPYFADQAHTCLKDRLTAFTADLGNFNAHLQHEPLKPEEDSFVPYIGNGYFGLEVVPDGSLYIKNGRTLLLPFKCQPVVETRLEGERWEEAFVVHYLTGRKLSS
jgi:hypothetical protein